MTETDEQLLEQFFSDARRAPVPDNGFTQRVMHRLPDEAKRLSRLWTAVCLLLAAVLFVAFRGWLPLQTVALELLTHLSSPLVFVELLGFATLAIFAAVAETLRRERLWLY